MTAFETEPAEADQASRSGGLRDRLVPPIPGSPAWGWVGPLLVTAFGAFLRFYRLGTPKAVVFDETYYVGDAYGILRHGVEINHASNANTLLAQGKTNILATGGELVVHPPLGKILIAGGEWLFGLTPFGWRFAVALVGSLSILMTARIARRMTRSTLLGCAAGLLLALDGLELVMSRTALLDIFVMFWVLAAFGCLVLDRDRSRARIATAAEAGTGDDPGPALGIRWWRAAAGVCLGAAVASKWNGIWYLPAFLLLTVFWDLGARRAAGYLAPWRGALVRDGKWLPVTFAVLPAAAYLASWSGWLASPYGYDRNWAALHGNHTPVWSALDSLYQYNRYMLKFGLGLTTGHPYKSQPWDWLLTTRPTSFYYATPKTCGVPSCSQEVLAIGTPFIWYASIPVLLACLAWWLLRRDWRAGAVLMGVAAGWLPWFWFALHDHRTEFYFYAVVFDPFLVIGIVLCLGLIIGPARAAPARRGLGAILSGAYLLAVLWDFWYMYPVLAAQVVPYSSWLSRMWYHGWI
ncbi:MAG TPA: phospholipid carrier-dependent glycosyltransferase [Streptosporangiaceae bacterium]|nr:phospholipid carrier-dependent glycosyltransferase [Streptosporangiaceae bacterium]